jgi:hypothetical protein
MVGLGVLALAALAAGPPADEPPPPPFNPLGVHAENLAVLTAGAGFTPGAGPLCVAGDLVAGTHRDYHVWDFFGPLSTRHGRTQLGAQTLFLGGFAPSAGLPVALTQLGVLQAGNDHEDADGCWALLDTDVLRPFPAAFRDGRIEDGKAIYVGTLDGLAFADLLVQSHFTSADAFRRAARRDLTYAQIFAEPDHYRGEVVHVQGRLGRLARLDPPLEAQARGVADQYEAWIFYDPAGFNPFCAIFTELPLPLRGYLGEQRLGGKNIEVAFDGYFFKKFRYKAGDSKENTARDAPVFVGRALRLVRPAFETPPGDDWDSHLMLAFIGLVALVVVVAIGLTWYFRHSDERVRQRLRAAREAGLTLPESGPPGLVGTVEPPDAEGGDEPGGRRGRGRGVF